MKAKDRKPSQFNATNERMKYKYRTHLRRIGQKDEKTLLAILKHIRALKDFFNWLERQRGYRSKINYNHIDYLNVSRNQRRSAKATEYRKAYSYEQIIEAIRLMPERTDKDKRNKAIVSLQALCTLRISELRTVKLSNMIQEDGTWFIHVSPKNMQTKFAKTRQCVFVPLPDDIKANVIDSYNYVKLLGFRNTDPLFPAIANRFNQQNLLETNITNNAIRSDTTLRNVFKACFTNAGQDYINPHSFRKTLARFAQTKNPAFLNAVRQNLGHSSIDTTLNSYG